MSQVCMIWMNTFKLSWVKFLNWLRNEICVSSRFFSVLAALNITTHILKSGGTFVAKVFRGKEIDVLCKQLDLFFEKSCVAKPRSSRSSSLEAFVVCRGFKLPNNYRPNFFNPFLNPDSTLDFASLTPEERKIIPYVSCGDLSGFDSDCSYPLQLDGQGSGDEKMKAYVYREPVQPPIKPPYEHAVHLKRTNQLQKPSGIWFRSNFNLVSHSVPESLTWNFNSVASRYWSLTEVGLRLKGTYFVVNRQKLKFSLLEYFHICCLVVCVWWSCSLVIRRKSGEFRSLWCCSSVFRLMFVSLDVCLPYRLCGLHIRCSAVLEQQHTRFERRWSGTLNQIQICRNGLLVLFGWCLEPAVIFSHNIFVQQQ